MQGICVSLASLCSLPNLDSVCSVNPSLKPRERLVKLLQLHCSYFKWSLKLHSHFSLHEHWAPIFSICKYTFTVQSSYFFLWFSFCFPFLHVFSHSCFIFNDWRNMQAFSNNTVFYMSHNMVFFFTAGLLPSWGKTLYASWKKKKEKVYL